MKLDFCADDIKFHDFDPRKMVVEVESKDHLREFIKAARLAFPTMLEKQTSEYVRWYDYRCRFYCLDYTSYVYMVYGTGERWISGKKYEVVSVEDLIYRPFLESNMDIKSLFEI